jgi:hypothetical protein
MPQEKGGPRAAFPYRLKPVVTAMQLSRTVAHLIAPVGLDERRARENSSLIA